VAIADPGRSEDPSLALFGHAAVLESLDEGVVVLDGNFHYRYWNSAFERLMLLPRSAGVDTGRRAWEIFPHITEHGIDLLMCRALGGEAVVSDPVPIIRPDGTRGYLAERYLPLRGKTGEIPGIMGIVCDITERTRRDEALSDAAQVYRSLIGQAAEGLVLVDEDGMITEWNRGMYTITGYPAELVLGRHSTEIHRMLCVEPEAPLFLPHTGGARREIVRVDGTRRIIEEMAFPIRTEQGSRVGSTIRDITGQEEVRCELERKNHHLSVLHQIVGAAGSSAGFDEMLEIILNQTIHLLGLDGGGIYLIRKRSGIAHPVCEYGLTDEFRRTMTPIPVREGAYRPVYVEGRAVYEDQYDTSHPGHGGSGFRSVARIPISTGQEVVGAIHLGSDRHPSIPGEDREILETIGRETGAIVQKGMMQQQIEDAYGRANLYLDILTHDIANAHTASLGYAELLAESLEGGDREMARRLMASIRHGVEILGNVSTIMRLQQEEEASLHAVPLDRVIESAIHHFPDADIAFEPSGLTVRADGLLPEIFVNLIGNSLKHGGEGTRVRIFAGAAGERVEIRVEDNGGGIPDEEKRDIFRRFQRGSSRASGKGLGLTIVRMLADRYAGEVDVEDRIAGAPEEGAAFVVRLQRAGDD
jgi:PAS domain S-box-containing protein